MPAIIPPSWTGRGVTTKNGIEYFMSADGYKEKWAQDASQTTIMAKVTFDDSDQFILDMLGFAKVEGSQLSRSLPEFNPYAKHQWCTSCDLVSAEGNPTNVEGFSNWIGFDWYTYQCTFTSPLWEYLQDEDVGEESVGGVTYRKEWLRNTVIRPKLEGRNQIIPGRSFVIDGDNTPIGQTTTLLQQDTTYQVEWMEVPISKHLNVNIRSVLGKINSTDWELEKGDVIKAKTLLFEKIEFTPRRSARGELTNDIKYIFRRKGKGLDDAGNEIDVTWQMFPRANRRYVGVHIQNSSDRPYQEAEFRKLFSFSST